MLVESQLLMDHFQPCQDLQKGIDGGAGPGHDQSALRAEDPECLCQYRDWPCEVLQNGEHGYVVEPRAFHRQAGRNVRRHQQNFISRRSSHVFVQAHAGNKPRFDVCQKRRACATAQIADRRTYPNMRRRSSKTQPGDKAVEPGIGHSSRPLERKVAARCDRRLCPREHPLHRRAIPRTLRKKLESTTWNPSVKNTTPGITMRSVFSGSSGPKWWLRQ